ncbi:hypothetical protein QE386_002356 [Pseudoxanthomonas winnipegensis]|nr:hypothetical protein [Pseudoxanthomonas winnipegensis]
MDDRPQAGARADHQNRPTTGDGRPTQMAALLREAFQRVAQRLEVVEHRHMLQPQRLAQRTGADRPGQVVVDDLLADQLARTGEHAVAHRLLGVGVEEGAQQRGQRGELRAGVAAVGQGLEPVALAGQRAHQRDPRMGPANVGGQEHRAPPIHRPHRCRDHHAVFPNRPRREIKHHMTPVSTRDDAAVTRGERGPCRRRHGGTHRAVASRWGRCPQRPSTSRGCAWPAPDQASFADPAAPSVRGKTFPLPIGS